MGPSRSQFQRKAFTVSGQNLRLLSQLKFKQVIFEQRLAFSDQFFWKIAKIIILSEKKHNSWSFEKTSFACQNKIQMFRHVRMSKTKCWTTTGMHT